MAKKHSEAELLKLFEDGLTSLGHMARIYDEGHTPIVFNMAVEIKKMLTENAAAMKLRGALRFMTYDDGHDPDVLTPSEKLICRKLSGDPPSLEVEPRFYSRDGEPVELKFREWWNRDVIYRASAAVPGTPLGMIPVNGSPVQPYEKRSKTTRRELIELLRNKMGAHQDVDLSELLEEIELSKGWVGFELEHPTHGVLSTDDGTLPIRVGVIAALVRQICHELLVAYGREDQPPADVTETI